MSLWKGVKTRNLGGGRLRTYLKVRQKVRIFLWWVVDFFYIVCTPICNYTQQCWKCGSAVFSDDGTVLVQALLNTNVAHENTETLAWLYVVVFWLFDVIDRLDLSSFFRVGNKLKMLLSSFTIWNFVFVCFLKIKAAFGEKLFCSKSQVYVCIHLPPNETWFHREINYFVEKSIHRSTHTVVRRLALKHIQMKYIEEFWIGRCFANPCCFKLRLLRRLLPWVRGRQV